MPLIVVTSSSAGPHGAGAGKTGVATAIARHYAYLGRPVQLLRAQGEGHAEEDAAYFHSLTFAPGSPGAPVVLADPVGDTLVVAEADAATAATLTGVKVVWVARETAPAKFPDGIVPAAIVVTDVKRTTQSTSDSVPTIRLNEDRCLAGFSVSEARSALNAEVLVKGDDGDPTCDHLVIAPISSDAGQPYFRRFPAKAVVVRFDRTDMHLAAMQTEVECLILTGGRRPMDYLFDAATAKGVPVLLSRTDTENTIIALEGIFDRTRFHGERKLERMAGLLEGSGLYEALDV